MWRLLALCFVISVYGKEEDERILNIQGLGKVKGAKYWDGDFHEFLGIPYATVPTGRDRFKAPLPPVPWKNIMKANKGLTLCPQVYYADEGAEEEEFLAGATECLVAHVMAPTIANEQNLVPVVVFIHSGGFAGGSGFMAQYHKVAQKDIVVVALNYRLGAQGFACLGTENIPGNAALKDLLAGLKWVNKYIKYFGGNPKKVTLAGYSVGATLAELLALTKDAKGLFHRLMLDSGSALNPFAINRDPINTARNVAKAIGFTDDGTIRDLERFLLESDEKFLQAESRHFFLKNSTFGFAPCIENPKMRGALLTESPYDILKRGKYGKFNYFAGFSNMEGISRTSQFAKWSDLMNDNFEDFLPADLKFPNDKERDDFVKEVKQKYFKGEKVSLDTLQGYVDYFSDSMFKYGVMRSAKLHATRKPIHLYEFTYVGKLNTKHMYMDKIFGASHKDAISYVLDFYDWTRNRTDLDHRDNMVYMWTDYVKYGDPTAFESSLLKTHWQKYTNEHPNYFDIGYELVNKVGLFEDSFQFWDKAYQKYYWTPTAPNPEDYKPTVGKYAKPKVKETAPPQKKVEKEVLKEAPIEKKPAVKETEKVPTEKKEVPKVVATENKPVAKEASKVPTDKKEAPKVAPTENKAETPKVASKEKKTGPKETDKKEVPKVAATENKPVAKEASKVPTDKKEAPKVASTENKAETLKVASTENKTPPETEKFPTDKKEVPKAAAPEKNPTVKETEKTITDKNETPKVASTENKTAPKVAEKVEAKTPVEKPKVAKDEVKSESGKGK